MVELSLRVVRKDGSILKEERNQDDVKLVWDHIYEEGDQIVLESSKVPIYLIYQIDDALDKAFVYITESIISYQIPFGEKKISYSPKSFLGDRHFLQARLATKEEIDAYKNLACNIMDQHGETNCYPHAIANVETRGESVFAARNAIDGITENRSHGAWPYQSWGINMQDDATMKVLFGRNVIVDKIILYTRADFPHDNWWTQVTLTFSDHSSIVWELEKSEKPHILTFEKKVIQWVELSHLIKSTDPSPFPALSQIEVYGMEA